MSFADIYEKYNEEVVDKTLKEGSQESSEGVETGEEADIGPTPPIEMGSVELGKFFGYSSIESHSAAMKSKLDEIYLMAKGFGIEDVPDYLDFVEDKIGEPKLGVSRTDHIYQYLKLASKASEAYEDVEVYGNKSSSSEQGQSDTVRASAENDEGSYEEGHVGGDT